MTIKKTLWTYGCSWTQGVGLKDNSTFKNNQWEDLNKASAYAWPNVLAKSINYNCVNNGHGGSSNLEIMHSILDTCQDWKTSDLVIVMWSYYERNIFYHRVPNDIEPWTYQCLPMTESDYKDIKWYNRYLKEDFDFDLYDSRIKSGYHRLNVEYLCNSLNVNCIHTEVEAADITDGVFESGNIKKKFVDPLQHYLEGNNNSSDKNALDGSHPSEKWHASTAMLFKKYMKKVNIISN